MGAVQFLQFAATLAAAQAANVLTPVAARPVSGTDLYSVDAGGNTVRLARACVLSRVIVDVGFAAADRQGTAADVTAARAALRSLMFSLHGGAIALAVFPPAAAVDALPKSSLASETAGGGSCDFFGDGEGLALGMVALPAGTALNLLAETSQATLAVAVAVAVSFELVEV